MAGWWLRDPAASSFDVRIRPLRSPSSRILDRQSSVTYGSRAAAPVVLNGPVRTETPKIPAVQLLEESEYLRFESLYLSGRRLVLESDSGKQWAVLTVGGLEPAEEAGIFTVEVTFVGVA